MPSEAIVQRETIHEDDIGGKATMGVGNKMQSVREREKKKTYKCFMKNGGIHVCFERFTVHITVNRKTHYDWHNSH